MTKKVKPEPGKLYRLGYSVELRKFHYYTRETIKHLPFGDVVVFLGFHPSSERKARVLSGEYIGWIMIPKQAHRKKYQFWRPVC